MSELNPFHLAIAVHDLTVARSFYGGLLGCEEGRSSQRWVDFNFFGHQLVCHLHDGMMQGPAVRNEVDHDRVPVPHFGMVLAMEEWQALRDRLEHQGVEFVIPPRVRFRGNAGEQATMFLADPSGNALEFKAFADRSRLFARENPEQ